ncbi:uncharacterized protein LOC121976610 [Zingiber officinale]|uniref:uncharacterized protein LOC121976610 n=1 Tax=Zingiber officinale TaxID=94328 RepID=UPI001C4D13FE|nr:uncharacterized protein LOC121976610 [Zingiber officinale]
MDSRYCHSLDPDSTPIQDSSTFLCDDVVVVDDFASSNIVAADIVDAGVVGDVEKLAEPDYTFVDKESVGDCKLEAIPQESPLLIGPSLEPNVDDKSVGTCAEEAEPQESLLFYAPPESELLLDKEEATSTVLEPPGP